jgi:hypothetical protein
MDRKALGRSLVGTSVNLPAMLNRQRAQLRLSAHPTRAEAFEFEILDTLTPSDEPDYDPSGDLRVLQDLWIEKLSPFDDRGYDTRKK